MTKNPSLLLCLCVLVFGFPEYASAMDEGKGVVENFEVGILVDGVKKADTWINLSDGGSQIEIPASVVLKVLADMVGPDLLLKLESEMTTSATFTNRQLSRYGIYLSINGPKRQVSLTMKKEVKAAAAPPPPLQSIPKQSTEEILKPTEKARIMDDSGPWTTPPTKTGYQRESDTTQRMDDTDWEPAKPNPNGTAQSPKIEPPLVKFEALPMDRTRDELFEEVFKHKEQPLPPSVEVTLLVDGKSYGTLWIYYSKEQKRYSFPVDPVLNALRGLIKIELWEKLAKRANSQSRFTVQDLIDCGFPTILNMSVFELSTGIPAQSLGTQIHSLSGNTKDPYQVPVYAQSAFSGYMNMRVKNRLQYLQYNPTPFDSLGYGKTQVETSNERSREPFVTNLDGAVNLFSWVVEGQGVVWEKPVLNEFEFSRQDIRLIHDWHKSALRLSVGDLIFPTSGFQSFQNIGGVGFSRDFSLQPHLVAYPVKEFEFFLTNPSEVKIFINGVQRGTYQLRPGNHDLKDFPFAAGESDVDIEILDNTGRQEVLHFKFIHEPSLLAKGTSAFSYNIGYPRRDTYNAGNLVDNPDGFRVLNYEYDLGHPFIFLDYRRGFSDRLTMEAYSQSLDTAAMVGLNALHALPLGKMKLDVAGSYRKDSDFDWAGNVEYTYIPKITTSVSPLSWRLKTEYLGKRFFRPFQDPGLLGTTTFSGAIQKNSKLMNGSIMPSYTLRPDSADFYSFTLNLNKNWGKGWSSFVNIRNNFNQTRKTMTSIAATVVFNFNTPENTVFASQRIENHQPAANDKTDAPDWDYLTDLNWSYNSSNPFPANPRLRATTSFGPLANEFMGGMLLESDQGTVEVMGRRSEPKETSVITNYVDFTLQSSLVFAGGSFAFARPISNSFVLVKGVKNESACDILVNPTQMGYDSKASKWFPGVVPYVSPYYLKNIHIEVKDPPLGSTEDRTDYTIYPGYKSGYAIYMGSEATTIALGTLVFESGVPVDYKTFTATALNGKESDPISAFTNGVGKFQLTRLQPGEYRIELEDEGKRYEAIMTLPKKSEGIKSVGILTLKSK